MKTEPMNPVVKAKWLEALRSGEYQQTDGLLRTAADGYCCLGVLSQLASDEGVVPQPKELNGSYRWVNDQGDSRGMYLLPEVMKWAGLDSVSGEIETEDHVRLSLSHMNDDGVEFPEIADAIEKYL